MPRTVMTLLRDCLEILESAYACPEWLRYGRTEKTDKTLEAVRTIVSEPKRTPNGEAHE